MGSRSMRAGISWLVFGFCNGGTETFMDLVARIGVERLTEGRLRAAGFMSTILVGVAVHRVVVGISGRRCRRG